MVLNNFNTVEVEHQTERGGLFATQPSAELSAEDLALGESVYALPKCHISVSTQSLVDLAYRTLEEVAAAGPDAAVQLFYSVRDMFDLFRAVVPTCHKESLENIPHAAIIFHNDCFYIAHHLLSLGHQFRKQLPEDLAKIATFIDMVCIHSNRTNIAMEERFAPL
jgi:centromere/kinetochore protein ZW10